MNVSPILLCGIVRRQQQQDLSLQGIGVLKLVYKNMREPLLEIATDSLIVTNQVSGPNQQIDKVEGAGLGF